MVKETNRPYLVVNKYELFVFALFLLSSYHMIPCQWHVLQITNVVEDLIRNYYDVKHYDPRRSQTIGPIITVSSDGTERFRRGARYFFDE